MNNKKNHNDTSGDPNTNIRGIDGKHILAEFWQCQCDHALISHAEPLTEKLCQAVASVGLTLVGQSVYEFQTPAHPEKTDNSLSKNTSNNALQKQTSGFTISLLLAESHLCLHTWGETATVTLDIYVCNVLHDNREKADVLFQICRDLLKPRDYNVNTINRIHAPHNNNQITKATLTGDKSWICKK